MELTGSHVFEADQDTVWKLLMDPDAIAKAIPGVKELIPVEGEEMTWRAAAKVGFAALSGHYAGVIKMSEVEAPTQYRLTVNGEGQQSVIGGTALIKLTFNPEKNETLVSWDAHANISGKIASLGQRLIGAGANVMSKQFFHELAKQLPTR